MKTKTKANIGIAMVGFFIIAVITGIILHLKGHGIVIQPRNIIKIAHWTAGYLMTALFFIHWSQFSRMLTALKDKFKWFYADTKLLIVLFIATLVTGTVKLLSPVKIPHLGLWHYWLGLTMGITALLHLVRGLPAWNRLRKAGTRPR